MAIIKSGASADILTIDPVSKAARCTQYKTSGVLLNPEYDGSYMARIEVIPTTLTDGTMYWSIRNTGAKRMFIRKVEMMLGFSGTAAASRSLYRFERFRTATPTGGTAITVIPKDLVFPATTAGDCRYAPGGLTVTGVTFDTPLHHMGHSNQLTANIVQDLAWFPEEHAKLVIAAGDGLCIRAYGAVIAGSYIVGSMTWDERT